MLETILDDDQDMQDMYLARRAEMAQVIAPDPDNPADDPANLSLANLPSISSSGVAETTLSQALQSVAATQEASSSSQAAAQQAAHNSGGQTGMSHQQDHEDVNLTRYPLEMAVPDQASLRQSLPEALLPAMLLCQQSSCASNALDLLPLMTTTSSMT